MASGIDRLLDVMARLRHPEGGCPWDLKQDHKSLARYLLEEAYEVVEAIEADDADHTAEELGDVLLQVVFHAQIAAENGSFTFDDVAAREADKMIERHPHVFGAGDAATAEDVLRNWEADKAAKRAAKAAEEKKIQSVLDDVNIALPALPRALKLQQRAARVGFDWKNPEDIIAKVREELDELEAEIRSGKNSEDTELELGDVLFVMTNLARRLEIDPEGALRRTNAKFDRRFRHIEDRLRARGQNLQDATLEEMETLWLEAKSLEKK